MANNNSKKQSALAEFRRKLLFTLSTAPEARVEDKKAPYPGGRFKRFKDTFKGNMTDLMTVNVLTVMFALPLLAVIMAFSIIGAERIGYFLAGIDTPYVMTDFGFGLSAGSSIGAVSAVMIDGYRILFAAIAVCLPILSFGIAGNVYICQKFIWGERLLTKKDKTTGGDVNRTVTEFFRGVKLHWKEMLVAFSCYAVFFAGGTELIVEFVSGTYLGGANAGQWIGLFVGIIVLIVSTMIFMHFIPQTVSYAGTLNMAQKLRNSAIYFVALFLEGAFIFILALAPFALAAAGTFLAMIVVLFLVTVGFSYVCLIIVNYADFNSENYSQAVLEIRTNEATRQSKKDRKKGESANATQRPQNYKKKKRK